MLEYSDNTKEIIELPADWKVTFSSVNPNSQGDRYQKGYCIRVYEGEKLRAVIGNAIGFRDLSIPLARKKEMVTEKGSWERDSAGNFSLEEDRKVLDSGFEPDEHDDPFED